MPDVTPHPKEDQLKPGRQRRYRRKVAGPKQRQALRAEKLNGRECRMTVFTGTPATELHHLVPRSQGGDDEADNLIPVCSSCHRNITNNNRYALQRLATLLTDAEYAYIIGKLGEGGPERLFGVNR